MAVFAQSWVMFAVFAGVGLLGYNICAKIGGGNLPPVMFATIMYTAGFVAIIPIFLWFMQDKSIAYIQSLPLVPVLFAAGAGLVVILVDTSVATMFNRDAPVGIGMTSINIIALSLTMLAGFFFFKESPSLINIAGVVLALISVPLMFYTAK